VAVERIPVTSVPRTLLDFAASSRFQPPPALNHANRLGLLDLIEIDELLARSRGQRGVRRLRLALEDFREPGFTRSDLERDFRRIVKSAGLPRPSTNLFVSGYELDAYWPEYRFAVELDSYEYHRDQPTFESDRLRQEDLKLAGIEMTRVTGRRMEREPTNVAKRLRALGIAWGFRSGTACAGGGVALAWMVGGVKQRRRDVQHRHRPGRL
jgi:very-short-patch-repair endonuclease